MTEFFCERVAGLPAVADEPSSDLACFIRRGDAAQPHLLVYECHRDFQSVPRTWAVLAFTCPDADALMLSSEDEALPQEPGVYRWLESPAVTEDAPYHLMIVSSLRTLEVVCESYELQSRIYHAADAARALAQYLSGCEDG